MTYDVKRIPYRWLASEFDGRWQVIELEQREGEEADRFLRTIASGIPDRATAEMIARLPKMIDGLLEQENPGHAARVALGMLEDAQAEGGTA